MRAILCLLGLTLFSLILPGPFAARAAPQMLGLVASAQPVPLICKDGTCSAEFSSFCLQAERKVPNPGTKYVLSADSVLTLVNGKNNRSGQKVSVQEHVSVESVRGFTSVRISISEAIVQEHGFGDAALKVSPLFSLIPLPNPEDLHPQSAAEIEMFTGPLRRVAEVYVGEDNKNLDIVLTFNLLINGLASDRTANRGDAAKLWRKMVVGTLADTERPGVKYVAKELAVCETRSMLDKSAGLIGPGFRSCIESLHNEFSTRISENVWKGLGAGG